MSEPAPDSNFKAPANTGFSWSRNGKRSHRVSKEQFRRNRSCSVLCGTLLAGEQHNVRPQIWRPYQCREKLFSLLSWNELLKIKKHDEQVIKQKGLIRCFVLNYYSSQIATATGAAYWSCCFPQFPKASSLSLSTL